MVAFVAGVLAFAVWQLMLERPTTDKRYTFGCFVSDFAPPIELNSVGVQLRGNREIFTSAYELISSRGYKIEVSGAFELVPTEGAYHWQPAKRGWTYLWSFEGPDKLWTRHATDFERLDVLEIRAEDGIRLRFERAANSECTKTDQLKS